MNSKSAHKISFSVFDIIYYNGEKITNLPLIERKEILNSVISEDTALLNKVQWIEGYGKQYFELIKQHGLEGIVQKKVYSTYQINKRSHDWLKVINYHYAEVFISGLRKDDFGVLLNFDNGNYAGLLEFMPTTNRKEFYKQYKDYIIEENKQFVYLESKLKCKVRYRNITKKGLLRTPSFVEWIS